MIDMTAVTKEAIAARPYFQWISPSWPALLRGKPMKWAKRYMHAKSAVRHFNNFILGAKPATQATGEFIGGRVIYASMRGPKNYVGQMHQRVQHTTRKDPWRKNGLGGRTFPWKPERTQLVIVFHDANRAGAHIDVHIGRFSLVRRIKDDVYEQLRFNSNGQLTQKSRRILLDFLREEIDNRARIPQNLDHTLANARVEFFDGSRDDDWYGAGLSRQILVEDEAIIYKAYQDSDHFEFYAPVLNPDRGIYVHKLYGGDETRAPICVWGNLDPHVPPLEERLHLKNFHPEDFEIMLEKSDMSTSTAKYDGSSVYVVTNNKGTHLWSPRHSVVTGRRIEYTFMVPEIAMHTQDEQHIAMGELLFKKKGWLEAFLPDFLERPRYLPQAEGSGLLNAHALRPKHVVPEIRLYRLDKIGNRKYYDEEFFANRELQKQFAATHRILKVVERMSPERARLLGFEGVVTVPSGASVNEGHKLKWWQDPNDWVVEEVSLREGDRGGIAGVVHFRSLESGKKFKLGPGQMGDHRFNREMMENPELFGGRVAKVKSKHGHEGRASRFVGWHDDK